MLITTRLTVLLSGVACYIAVAMLGADLASMFQDREGRALIVMSYVFAAIIAVITSPVAWRELPSRAWARHVRGELQSFLLMPPVAMGFAIA